MNNQRSNPSAFANYNFDFGLPTRTSSSARPLKDLHSPNPNPSAAPAQAPKPTASSSSSKPSWTHQPSPVPAMAGDIFGKTWSAAPAPSAGIPRSNPNLFGDLLGAALGQGKASSSSAPLKTAPPRHAYSTGNLTDSLPNPSAIPASRRSADSLPTYTTAAATAAPIRGPSTKSTAAQGKDPFGDLMGFATRPPSATTKAGTASSGTAATATTGGFSFGDSGSSKGTGVEFSFEAFQGSGSVKTDTFGVPPANSTSGGGGIDPLENLFSSSSAGAAADAGGGGEQMFGDMDDWDMGGGFDGGDGGGTTTELDGLPPPPAGVTASAAKDKGLDCQKQGQFADAIKWLSWAVVLTEKSRNAGLMVEALISRAGCYKEVGEYKKAIADCSKILDGDSKNVAVLVQRALLYESTEKYKLGAEDLRAVLRIDPTNRLAKTTIHRLTQLAG